MNYLIFLIVAAEMGFWLLILLGLYFRYKLHKPKLSLVFFIMAPIVDVLLLIATALDIKRGGTVGLAHALSAIYIGFSVGFGRNLIAKADVMYREYILKENVPSEKLYGKEHRKKYFEGTIRHLITYLVGAGLMYAFIVYVGDADKTRLFSMIIKGWTVILVIDILINLSYVIHPKKRKS
ncbi:hypothetical protein ERX37_00580 [Macrococcus hajekii]|uniref:Uncharacterized protein n=1 Tax=Macrococcus hajekii TaxID=198482 RepID=A0A4V3BE94_9STAP|nr:hypothetical protein [Macrococcus hajekii]TDM02615.1 hypothetical protein ERX37_00580 [Macrococcus hajekii]GGB02495.1 putative membrane protein YmcC [Macrococcus hajekii]